MTIRQEELREVAEVASENGHEEKADELFLLSGDGKEQEDAFANYEDQYTKAPKAKIGQYLSSIEREDIAWVWPNVFPRKFVTFMYGDPGIGKSTFRDDLLKRITTGQPFPDGSWVTTKGRSVILISVEEDLPSVVLARLEDYGANLDMILDLSMVHRDAERYGVPDSRFMLPDDINILESAIVETKATFVVLDPLMGILNPRMSGARNQSARDVVNRLQAMAYRHGTAIFIIGHYTKSSSKDRRIRAGGSAGFYDIARQVLFFEVNPQNKNQRVIILDKHNMSKGIPELVCQLDENDNLEYIMGIDEETRKANETKLMLTTRERILDLLNGQPDSSFQIDDIAFEIGAEYPATAQALRRMVRAKPAEVVQEVRGLYHAVEPEPPIAADLTI